ncbi:MAG: HEAT repeat domain-containing protein [Thermoguttaceae bacterium]
MKKLIFVFMLLLSIPLFAASDWDTTGKGGSTGKLTPEQIEAAWTGFQTWVAGTDAEAVRAMDWIVINATSDPELRKATAARLAKMLAEEKTSADAKKYICAKLYRIGTDAEVPLVAPLLMDPATVDDARFLLERIRSEAAVSALRDAFGKLTGRPQIGVMNSLSLIQDEASFAKIAGLTQSADDEVARAAWRAVGNYASDAAVKFLTDSLKAAKEPNIRLESAAVRTVGLLEKAGKNDQAEEIYALLAQDCRTKAGRLAGLNHAFKKEMMADWYKSEDPVKIRIATQNDPTVKEIEYNIPETASSLLAKLKAKPDNPDPVIISQLVALKCYDCIDPLVQIARNPDPAVYMIAVDGLRGICDPDVNDLRRMVKLFVDLKDPEAVDAVSRAIGFIASKAENPEEPVTLVLRFLNESEGKETEEFHVKALPMLGRLGTGRVWGLIQDAQKGTPALQAAAARAICNWPNAAHADLLWKMATESKEAADRQQALRAFIRVITIPSSVSPDVTLEKLQDAFRQAEDPAEMKFAVQRAAAIRTTRCVAWLASLLDCEVTSQEACASIVELAHHRFLRQPNKAFFEPILLEVEKVAKDKNIQVLAEKARMGM